MILEHPYFSDFYRVEPTTPAELYIAHAPNDFLNKPLGIRKFNYGDVLEQWRGAAVNPELDSSQIMRMFIKLEEEATYFKNCNRVIRSKFMEVASELLAHKNLPSHLIDHYMCFGASIDVFDDGAVIPNSVIINPSLTPEQMDLFFIRHVYCVRPMNVNTARALLVQMNNATPELLDKWFRGIMDSVGYSGLIDITTICTLNERCPPSICDHIMAVIFDNSYFGTDVFQTTLTPAEKQALLQVMHHKNSSKEISNTLRRKILGKYNDLDFQASEVLELFVF